MLSSVKDVILFLHFKTNVQTTFPQALGVQMCIESVDPLEKYGYHGNTCPYIAA